MIFFLKSKKNNGIVILAAELVVICVGIALILSSGVLKNENNAAVDYNKPLLYTGAALLVLSGLGLPMVFFRVLKK